MTYFDGGLLVLLDDTLKSPKSPERSPYPRLCQQMLHSGLNSNSRVTASTRWKLLPVALIVFFLLPSPVYGISCGTQMLTYAVQSPSGSPTLGIRCVRVYSSSHATAEFIWYGEGKSSQGSYRHVGIGYTSQGEFGSRAVAADVYGNGESFQNQFTNLNPVVTDGSWPRPQKIRITGQWDETWELTSNVDYLQMPHPTQCGPRFTQYLVRNPTNPRLGIGVRCVLQIAGLPGSYLWFGTGEWNNARYSHVGSFDVGSGSGRATDICDAFGSACNDFPAGSLLFTSDQGEYRVAGAWNEQWLRPVREVWLGTGPSCSATPSDCSALNMTYVRSDSSTCRTGTKVLCECTITANSRPFYLIAHRSNDLQWVKRRLELGANAIEIDARYDPRGRRFCVNHDNTWNCDNENIVPFLEGLRNLADTYPGFALLIIDLKDHQGNNYAYRDLLAIVRSRLTSPTRIKVILSTAKINSPPARALISSAGQTRRSEGFAIDQENDVEAVANVLNRYAPASGRAYGNGTFRFGISLNIRRSIRRAVSLRDQGRFDFVYVWTIGTQGSMRAYINDRVDGIFVNEPEIDDLKRVTLSACASGVRTAIRTDPLR